MTSNTSLRCAAICTIALCTATATAIAADGRGLPRVPNGVAASAASRMGTGTVPAAPIRPGGGNAHGAPGPKPAASGTGGWDVTTNKRV